MDRNRISMREGKAYIDGELILDSIKLEVVFTPEVVESRGLGQKGKSRRWLGHDVTGTISEYRSTPWLKETVKKYQKSGKTPKLTITGIMNDGGSDYYADNGIESVTVESAVLTGDITLIQLDAEGEHVIDELEFGAENVIM